eukprot:380914-Prorocentrum_minimum.AAC.3
MSATFLWGVLDSSDDDYCGGPRHGQGAANLHAHRPPAALRRLYHAVLCVCFSALLNYRGII